MKSIISIISILTLSILAGCSFAPATSEDIETETLGVDHPQEGWSDYYHPNYPHQPDGTRLWKKCPSWRAPDTNLWYSRGIHPNAKVYYGDRWNVHYPSLDGTNLVYPFLNTDHDWNDIAPPYQQKDYIKSDGMKRLFLMVSATDPTGPAEEFACVYVNRNDAYSNAVPSVPPSTPALISVPFVDEGRNDPTACGTASMIHPPAWPDGFGDIGYNPATKTYNLTRRYPVFRTTGPLNENTKWYTKATVHSGPECRKYVFTSQGGCKRVYTSDGHWDAPSHNWSYDHTQDVVTGIKIRYYMGSGPTRPNTVMWTSCGG